MEMEEIIGHVLFERFNDVEEDFNITLVDTRKVKLARAFGCTIQKCMIDRFSFDFVGPDARFKSQRRIRGGEDVSEGHGERDYFTKGLKEKNFH